MEVFQKLFPEWQNNSGSFAVKQDCISFESLFLLSPRIEV